MFVPGPPTRGATIGDRALPPTPATPAEATAPGRPPLRGAPGASLRPVALGGQERVNRQKRLPAAVPWVLVAQQHTPLRQWLLLALALLRPSVNAPPLGCWVPIDERPSIIRIAPQLVAAMPTRQAPEASPPAGPRADLRPRQRCLTIPAHGLTGPTQCM